MLLRQRSILGVFLPALLVLIAGSVRGDKLTLNDGTVIEGTVIKQGEKYWVKTPDGFSRTVAVTDVATLVRGSSPPPGVTLGTKTPSVSPAPTTTTYANISRRIESADTVTAIITILNDFIKSKPSDEDVKLAKTELAKWTEMATTGGEKINGKWVTGDDYKNMVEKAHTLVEEAIKLAQASQTLQSIDKLNEANKVYPNSFEVNFWLGYTSLLKDNADQALPFFEKALKINPKSAEATANIGLVYFRKKQFEKAIVQLHRAAELGDTPEIAFDLVGVLNDSPEVIQRKASLKPAIEAAHLLQSKYSVPGDAGRSGLTLVRLMERRAPAIGEEAPPGSITSGTGFVVAADGLILTNRHVVKGGKSFEVILQGGTKVSAEVVVIDDTQDLALIRIKAPKPMGTVQFAEHDIPGDGAECTVIGFPLGNRYTSSPKVTHGIVTSSKISTEGADVLIDAKVNPGNSGGPILDKSGNVMAIVAMKSRTTSMEDSYGIGISAGKIRQFLDKNKVKPSNASGEIKSLSVEEIAAKIEPVTVLILSVH